MTHNEQIILQRLDMHVARLDRLEKCVLAMVEAREADCAFSLGYQSPEDVYWHGPWDEFRKARDGEVR